jgi:signal transduction histidine kinase
MKTQTRIALTFFIITLAIMIVLGSGVYFFVIKYTFNDFYKRLETRAVLAARIRLDNEPASATAFQEMRDRILEKLPQEEDYFFEITPGKDFQHESESLKLPVTFFDEIAQGKTSRYQKGNIFFSGILYRQGQRAFIVIVSAENYYYSHHLNNLKSIMGVATVVVSLLVLSVSIWFSRYVFLPVRQITDQVKAIHSQNLHLRLQASSVNDDVNELKNTFNTMLDRLETSFATQNNFISNASHELGTPLTAIIGEADVALSKTRNQEEYRESIGIILTEAERLERITKSLLFLAQTGFDGKKVKMETVRIDQLIWDVKETIEKMNPKNKVNIDLSLMPDNHLKLKIKGNSQLLHLAISNIVSNGCKYSSHQPVKLSIGATDDSVIVVVQDTGIGIPLAEMPYIYDPFYRASNTHNFEGYGIGLPLARNIMRLHNATIVVTSAVNEGTTVRLTFPLGNVGQP